MKIEEFVLLKPPKRKWKSCDKWETRELVESLIQDPMEKALIRKRLYEIDTGLCYRPDLIVDFIQFYKEYVHMPFGFILCGLSVEITEKIIDNLTGLFEGVKFERGRASIRAHSPIMVYSSERQKLAGFAGFSSDFITLILEYIGHWIEEDVIIPVCVIYNRRHDVLGYVCFKL